MTRSTHLEAFSFQNSSWSSNILRKAECVHKHIALWHAQGQQRVCSKRNRSPVPCGKLLVHFGIGTFSIKLLQTSAKAHPTAAESNFMLNIKFEIKLLLVNELQASFTAHMLEAMFQSTYHFRRVKKAATTRTRKTHSTRG